MEVQPLVTFCVQYFLKDLFPVGNHSFTSSLMLSVLSALKPRVDCKIRKFGYLMINTSWTFISKCSSKTFVSLLNGVSLLVVLITSSVETVRQDTVPSKKTLVQIAVSIVIFLYLIIIPTAYRRRFHCFPAGFCSLNSIHSLNTQWAIISIEREIGVRSLKAFYIIVCCIYIDYFMNGIIFILKFITDI